MATTVRTNYNDINSDPSPTTSRPVSRLHQLVRDGDTAGIRSMESKCAPAEWQRALCGRDQADLTPLAVACQLGNVEAVSALLSLGSARSIFVRGFGRAEILCTLPYVSAVPDRHASAQGRALACERQQVVELAERNHTDALKDAVDSSLAKYIRDLAAGTVMFFSDSSEPLQDDESASKASTVERARSLSPSSPGKADPRASRDTMCAGDLVRLKPGLPGSTILISQRGTDNRASSKACLGAEERKRIGVVVRATELETLMVASLASGHLCEYHRQDLIFADGTCLTTASTGSGGGGKGNAAGNAIKPAGGFNVGDLVTLKPRTSCSPTPDSSSRQGARHGAAVSEPKAGDVVKMTSSNMGAPPGISSISFCLFGSLLECCVNPDECVSCCGRCYGAAVFFFYGAAVL